MNYERANHKWDEARDAQLATLWTEGVRVADIAVRMSTTIGAIEDRRGILALPKRRNPNEWTDAQSDLVAKLWIEGKSAGEISRLVPGKSKNAVIGRVHRLGLSKQGRAACAAPPPDVRKRLFKVAKPARPAKPAPVAKIVTGGWANAVSSPALQQERAAEGHAAAARVSKTDVESPNARPFLEATKGCKWPLGERGAIMSCCNPVADGKRYCPGHYAVSIASQQPKPVRPREASHLTRFDRVEKDRPRTIPDRSVWDEPQAEAA
jgi:GcrA cell cycle regulator